MTSPTTWIFTSISPKYITNALPERKRDIILLSYFLDMSDAEIAELLNVVRTTVFRHRKSALAKIKQYLEGKADDEYR